MEVILIALKKNSRVYTCINARISKTRWPASYIIGKKYTETRTVSSSTYKNTVSTRTQVEKSSADVLLKNKKKLANK